LPATTVERPLRLVENLWTVTLRIALVQVFYCSQTLDEEVRPNHLRSIWARRAECQTVPRCQGMLVRVAEGVFCGVLVAELVGAVTVGVGACTDGAGSRGAPNGRSGTDTSTNVQVTWRAR